MRIRNREAIWKACVVSVESFFQGDLKGVNGKREKEREREREQWHGAGNATINHSRARSESERAMAYS